MGGFTGDLAPPLPLTVAPSQGAVFAILGGCGKAARRYPVVAFGAGGAESPPVAAGAGVPAGAGGFLGALEAEGLPRLF